MKNLKKILILVLSAMFILSLFGCSQPKSDTGNFKIVTSFYPLYLITSSIAQGAENVEILNLTKPTQGCLHDYQLTTGDLKSLEGADCLIINGLGMENFIDKAIAQYPDIVIINSSQLYEGSPYKLNLIESQEHSHDHNEEYEHDHSDDEDFELNPHIWLDLNNASAIADGIAHSLMALNTENSVLYRSNADDYMGSLAALNKSIPKPNHLKTISFHEGFDYLLEAFGYEIEITYSLEENTQPSAKKLAEIIDTINLMDIKTIFASDDNTLDIAKTVANETGAELVILSPVTTGTNQKEEFINQMSDNIRLLREASNEQS